MNYDLYDIVIPTHRDKYLNQVLSNLDPIPVRVYDGTGCVSFSKLVNRVALSSEKENIIWVCDKMIIKQHEIDRMINLLEDKYCFVGLHSFSFFGFKKQLLREVGFWDERFEGGEMSDCDYIRRIKLKNLAIYLSFESYKIQEGSSWHHGNVYSFYKQKWLETDTCDYKLNDGAYHGASLKAHIS